MFRLITRVKNKRIEISQFQINCGNNFFYCCFEPGDGLLRPKHLVKNNGNLCCVFTEFIVTLIKNFKFKLR